MPKEQIQKRQETEAGSAVVDFIFFSVLTLIPILYFILTLGQLQGASLAAAGAADQAAKVMARSAGQFDAGARSEEILGQALRDFGLHPESGSLTLKCSQDCRSAGSTVTVRVEVRVPFPLLAGLSGLQAAKVSAESSQLVGKS